jgi:NAD(P)-dependent dehydrogenase (short-subunit alcohol dehydrogenase family)
VTAAPPAEQTMVVHQPDGLQSSQLETALLDVFNECRAALGAGRAVVVVLREEDILGHGTPVDAAAAHAVVGLIRGLAVEGVRDGWRINGVTVSGDEPEEKWMVWAHRLTAPEGATGAILRLGSTHLGRVGV